MALPTDSAARKTYPMYEGLLKYFPDALAEVSHISWEGNQKHNPGEPLHWAKEKSTDHQDCVLRHMMDALAAHERGEYTTEGKELAAEAWRALAALQTWFDEFANANSSSPKYMPRAFNVATDNYDNHCTTLLKPKLAKPAPVHAEDAKGWEPLLDVDGEKM